ncbi:fimbrial protein [Cupriavidus campinensis]
MRMHLSSPAMPRAAKLCRLAAVVGAVLAGAGAFAADPSVTLSFQGNYVIPSCNIAGPADHVVNLPKISTNSLATAGSTAGSTPFTITVQCTGGSAVVGVAFNSTRARDGRLDVQAGAGMAQDVQIQLLNINGSPIAVGNSATVTPVSITSAEVTPISFIARYYATGPTKAGVVQTSAIYVIEMR